MKIIKAVMVAMLLSGCMALGSTKPERYKNEPNDLVSCQNRSVLGVHAEEDKAKGIATVYGYAGLKIAEIIQSKYVVLYMRGPSFGVTHTYYSIKEFKVDWPEGFRLVACYATRREA